MFKVHQEGKREGPGCRIPNRTGQKENLSDRSTQPGSVSIVVYAAGDRISKSPFKRLFDIWQGCKPQLSMPHFFNGVPSDVGVD